MSKTIGLDVGGAHLKVATLEDGQLTGAHQIICPLWKGLDRLDAALSKANGLTEEAGQIAITMTGELSDLFETREQGVHSLVSRLALEFGNKARFWMGQSGFGTAGEAITNHQLVGSTNFLATAQAIAGYAPNALLIDMGSTTTDIVPVVDGTLCVRGLSDAARLETGELVYTGLTRTAVMAVCNRVPFDGKWQTMVREHLATMADIYRVLGQLPEGVDLHDTADGRGKSFDESLARFARMLGRETNTITLTETEGSTRSPAWTATAQFVANEQLKSIEEGVFQVVSENSFRESPTVVAAGIGAHIVAKVSTRLELAHTTFGELLGAPDYFQDAVTHNAPAVAVALLSER